jgi:hypothetical protein
MANYTLTTNAPQEEALTYTLRVRNAKRTEAGLPVYASIQDMLTDLFNEQVKDAQQKLRDAESGKLVDAFYAPSTTVAQRQAIRADLGYTL